MSFAKAIASDYPRGVNFVVETDFYYPMYSSISELFPKDKKPTTTTTPKPATVPTIPIMSAPTMESEKFDSFPGTYFDSSDFLRRQVRITVILSSTLSNTFHESRIRMRSQTITARNTFRWTRATNIGNHQIRIIICNINRPQIIFRNQFILHQMHTRTMSFTPINTEIWIGDNVNCIEVGEICTVISKEWQKSKWFS